MKRKIVAVDVDDVLVPHFQDLVDWYNQTYGTKLTLAHNGRGDPKPWGAETVEEAIKRVGGFFDSNLFKDAKPFKEAVAAVNKLSKRFDLVVITARDTPIEAMTRDWLDKHFKDYFREAHFTARYNLDKKSSSKASVCASISASYLIDDTPNNLIESLEVGVKGLLFGDYPWSHTVKALPASIVRVKDWPAVLRYFDAQS